jgi:hypothetical protein
MQAIANTAGFHFPTIEQGGSSLYGSLIPMATSLVVLRILYAIGGSEIAHFFDRQCAWVSSGNLSGPEFFTVSVETLSRLT